MISEAMQHVERTWDNVWQGHSTTAEKLEFGAEFAIAAVGMVALTRLGLSRSLCRSEATAKLESALPKLEIGRSGIMPAAAGESGDQSIRLPTILPRRERLGSGIMPAIAKESADQSIHFRVVGDIARPTRARVRTSSLTNRYFTDKNADLPTDSELLLRRDSIISVFPSDRYSGIGYQSGAGYMVGNELATTVGHAVTSKGYVQPFVTVGLSDGSTKLARVVAVAPYEDIAILHVPESSQLPPISLKSITPSSDCPEYLYVHGFPKGPPVTDITVGRSGKLQVSRRNFPDGTFSPNEIAYGVHRVDVVNGNSGGPYLSKKGESWGTVAHSARSINDPSLSSMGPVSNHTLEILTQLQKRGELPIHGWIDITTEATLNKRFFGADSLTVKTLSAVPGQRRLTWLSRSDGGDWSSPEKDSVIADLTKSASKLN